MKCVIDGKRDIEKPYACDPCVSQLDTWLAEIGEWWPRVGADLDPLPDLKRERAKGPNGEPAFTTPPKPKKDQEPVEPSPLFHRDPIGELVPAGLVPGQTSAPRVAGSREAPLPFNPVVFDLVTPFPFNRDSAHNVLSTSVRDWCETFAGPHHMPAGVPQMTVWLRNRLDVARDRHPAIDEFHGEIRALHGSIRRVVGETDPKPELTPTPCKKCDLKALVKLNDGSGYIRCSGCGVHLTETEYDQWARLLVAHLKRGRVAA